MSKNKEKIDLLVDLFADSFSSMLDSAVKAHANLTETLTALATTFDFTVQELLRPEIPEIGPGGGIEAAKFVMDGMLKDVEYEEVEYVEEKESDQQIIDLLLLVTKP